MAFYENKSVDQWVANADRAKSLVVEGQYVEAKAELLASLDGHATDLSHSSWSLHHL